MTKTGLELDKHYDSSKSPPLRFHIPARTLSELTNSQHQSIPRLIQPEEEGDESSSLLKPQNAADHRKSLPQASTENVTTPLARRKSSRRAKLTLSPDDVPGIQRMASSATAMFSRSVNGSNLGGRSSTSSFPPPSRVLLYGDVVTLRQEQRRNYLFCDGFVKSTCEACSFDDQTCDASRFEDALFVICTTMQYTARKALVAAQRYLDDTNAREDAASPASQEDIKKAKEALQSAQREAEVETTQNQEEYRRNVGTELVYGASLQLRHAKTGKWMTFRFNEPAREERCLQCVLDVDGGKGSWLSVMPAYKTRVEGEHVRDGDPVQLVSLSKGLYLHTSPLDADKAQLPSQEVNASDEVTRWVVNFYSAHARKGDSGLKAGDKIRLYHRDAEGYLVYEPSAWLPDAAPNVAADDDHQSWSDRVFLKICASPAEAGSNSLWELEQEDYERGGVAKWKQVYRIRHIATGRYLGPCLENWFVPEQLDLEVHDLKQYYSTAACLFSLYPLDTSEKSIRTGRAGSLFKVQHLDSGFWLNTLDDDPATSPGLHAANNHLQKACSQRVVLSKKRTAADAFCLEVAERAESLALAFVSSSLRALRAFADTAVSKSPSHHDVAQACEVLRVLLLFCKKSCKLSPSFLASITDAQVDDAIREAPSKKAQKLLFEHKALDVLVEVISCVCPDPGGSSSATKLSNDSHLHQVVRLCFMLIRTVIRDRPEFGSFLVRHRDVIFNQIQAGVFAEKVVWEMYHDNATLLKGDMSQYIRHVIDQLDLSANALVQSAANSLLPPISSSVLQLTDKSLYGDLAGLLSFLQLACSCHQKALSDNQHLIYQLVFCDPARLTLLPILSINSANQVVVTSALVAGAIGVPLRDLLTRRYDGLQSTPSANLGVFSNKLSTSRTASRPPHFLTFFQNYILFLSRLCMGRHDKCMHVISSGERPLISKEVCQACLLDERLPSCVRAAFCDLAMYLYVDAHPHREQPLITYTRAWVSISSDRIVSRRTVCGRSQRLGIMELDDVQRWMSKFPTSSAQSPDPVPGSTDNGFVSAVHQHPAAYDEDDMFIVAALRLVRARIRFGCLVGGDALEAECEVRAWYMAVFGFLKHLVSLSSVASKSQRRSLFGEAKTECCRILMLLHKMGLSDDMTRVLAFFKATFFRPGQQGTCDSNKQLVLLEQLFGRDTEAQDGVDVFLSLIREPNDTLVSSAIHLVLDQYTLRRRLRQALERVQLLTSDASVKVYERTSELMAHVRLNNNSRLTRETAQSLSATIEELATLCGDGVGEASFTNQHILANADAYPEIMAVLALTNDTHETRNPDCVSALRRLVDAILTFLSQFCKGSYDYQLVVFKDIDLLLAMLTTDSYVAACHCIMEVLRDNEELCQKLTVNHLRYVVHGISTVGRKPIFLNLLMGLVMLHGRPVRFNQKLVFKVAHERAKVVFPHFGDGPQVASMRNELIRRQDSLDSSTVSDLVYFTECVTLMAKCSVGKNFDVESVCQRMLPWQECVASIKDATVQNIVKQSYLEFFLQIYIDTERPVNQLRSDGAVWDVLDYLTGVIESYHQSSAPCLRASEAAQAVFANPSSPHVTDPQADFILHAIVPFVSRVMLLPFSTPEDILQHRLPVLDRMVAALTRLGSVSFELVATPSLQACIDRVKATCDLDLLRSAKPRVLTLTDVSYVSRKLPHIEDECNVQLQQFVSQLFRPEDESKDLSLVVRAFETVAEVELRSDADVIRLPSSKAPRSAAQVVPLPLTTSVRVLDHTLVSTLIRIVSKKSVARHSELAALRVNVLRVLRRSLHKDPEHVLDDERDTEASIPDASSISRDRQDLLARCHAPELIVRLISEDCESEIKANSLKLGVWMLNGGNRTAQEAFYRAICNLKSSNFFDVLRQMLRRTALVLKEQKHLQSRRRKQPLFREDPMDWLTNASRKAGGEMENEKARAGAVSVVEDVRWILVLLQQFCEGRNKMLQDYIRSQKGSVKSIDICFETVKLMHELERFLDGSNLACLVQSFKTLTDMMSGPNAANQQLITSALGGFEAVNRVFKIFNARRPPSMRFHAVALVAAKTNLTKLLLTLLEGFPDSAVIARMCMSLDVDSIVDNMRLLYEASLLAEDGHAPHQRLQLHHLRSHGPAPCQVDPMLQREGEELGRAFQGRGEELLSAGQYMYILLNTLRDSSSSFADPLTDKVQDVFLSHQQCEFFAVFQRGSARIEVIIHDKLQRLYFPIPPICSYLDKKRRLQIARDLKRDSPSTKIDDLLSRAPELLREMEIKHSLHQHRTLSMMASGRFFALVKYLSFLIAVLQNLRLLTTQDDSWQGKRTITSVTAIVQVFLSLFLLFIYLLQNWKLILYKGYKNRYGRGWLDKDDNSWETIRKRRGSFGILWDSIYFIAHKRYVWYMLLYIVFAILGTWDDRFFTFHLVDIVYRSATLRTVFSALVRIYTQLIAMLLFGVLVVYIFSIIGYTAFQGDYVETDLTTTGDDTYCEDFVHCWFFGLWGAFMNNNQFFTHDVTILDIWNTARAHAIGRFLFDTLFYIIFGVLVLNIVFGIMIDAFADIRDRNREIEEDIHNRCYICNFDRDTLDRDGQGFERHVSEDHNMWHYVYFLVHLMNTPDTDYFGPESHIASKVLGDSRDWSFAPTNRALCVEDKVNAQERNQEEILASLTAKLQDIVDKIDATAAVQRADFVFPGGTPLPYPLPSMPPSPKQRPVVDV